MTCDGPVDIVRDAVSVRVQSGQKTGTRRRAKRRCDERISKECAFAGNAIDIGCFDKWVTGSAKIIPAQIVDEDENDIGRALLWTIGLRATHQRKDHQQHCAWSNYEFPHLLLLIVVQVLTTIAFYS